MANFGRGKVNVVQPYRDYEKGEMRPHIVPVALTTDRTGALQTMSACLMYRAPLLHLGNSV